MRYVSLTIFCTALAACNTPSIGFRGIDPATVTVEGSTFDVRVKGTEPWQRRSAPICNMGHVWAKWGGGRASVAIEQVSGCKVKRFGGAQADIFAELDCKSAQLGN